jgi:hypothetical protein
MDASTLLYLSKMASGYPSMAAMQAAASLAVASNVPTEPTAPSSFDPSLLNSMTETYLRKLYADSFSSMAGGNAASALEQQQVLFGGMGLNNSSLSASPSSNSSSLSNSLVSPSSTPSGKSISGRKLNSQVGSESAAAAAAANAMLALKTLSNQFNSYAAAASMQSNPAINSSASNASAANNGGKFSIADILGLAAGSKMPSNGPMANSSITSQSPIISPTLSSLSSTSSAVSHSSASLSPDANKLHATNAGGGSSSSSNLGKKRPFNGRSLGDESFSPSGSTKQQMLSNLSRQLTQQKPPNPSATSSTPGAMSADEMSFFQTFLNSQISALNAGVGVGQSSGPNQKSPIAKSSKSVLYPNGNAPNKSAESKNGEFNNSSEFDDDHQEQNNNGDDDDDDDDDNDEGLDSDDDGRKAKKSSSHQRCKIELNR